MSDDHRIVTLTINPSLDISADVDTLEPTTKMRCRNVMIDPGGGGINVSRAITLLGGTTTAVFPAGGSTGRSINSMLSDEGVRSEAVSMEGTNRQNFAIREKESGRQYRFALPGPQIREEEWRQSLHKTGKLGEAADFVVASGSLPPGAPDDFYGRVVKLFNGSPTKVIVDTSGDALKHALQQEIYLIKPNRQELEYICGCSLVQEKDQEKMCRDMVDRGKCEVLVLTLGKDGALLTSAEEQVRIPALKVREVSSIGAGDSFVGAMVLALQRGEELADALLYGMAAGTAALTTEATQLCRKEDTDRLFEEYREIHRAQR
ncbi:1-phosphofructokinase family hexose kinase [Desulfopila inferna]|uniref:1-phosphofructokinase family hexose kinase n=1 Tax=Desulfopila inferna TaxID=468528 RepID=UPI0019635D6E|nr:1-phosphofructokinase family hexose kinase [Desulfopila inferna]MBM9606482.1 1-phosphofructokinase family hexose kinase [Desulfopila inferna]